MEIKVLDYNTFYAPNAFTPNGDGLNDEFMVKGTGLSSEGFKMIIYNRWGELVFESNDINIGWNGFIKNNQKVSPNGIYTWIVSAKDEMGRKYDFKGNVMIMQ
jgi:gliding motility-associated-like protein